MDATLSKRLREERAPLAEKIKEFADKNAAGEWSAEDEGNFEKLNADFDALSERIARAEASEKRIGLMDADSAPVEPGREDRDTSRDEATEPESREQEGARLHRHMRLRDKAFEGWTRRQFSQPIGEEHVEAARQVGVNLNQREFEFVLPTTAQLRSLRDYWEGRAQGTTSLSVGGALIPEGFVPSLERARLAFDGPRAISRLIRTDSGNDLPFPTVDDTSNTGRSLAENAQVTETAVALGQLVLHAHKLSSDLVLVPTELMEDSAIDLPSEIGSLLGERLARKQAAQHTTGTGAGNQPKGCATAAVTGKTTASSTAIAFDEIYDLENAVDPAYRSDPSVYFMFHSNIRNTVRKLKDGEGRYLWQSSVQVGTPDSLIGYPVMVNQNMASTVTSGDITMLFGAFSKFIIREVRSIRLYRLMERYRDYDQDGFVAFIRHDSGLLDAGTNPLKKMVQV